MEGWQVDAESAQTDRNGKNCMQVNETNRTFGIDDGSWQLVVGVWFRSSHVGTTSVVSPPQQHFRQLVRDWFDISVYHHRLKTYHPSGIEDAE